MAGLAVGPFKLHVSRISHLTTGNGKAPERSGMEPERGDLQELGSAGRGWGYSLHTVGGNRRNERNPAWRGKKRFETINEMKTTSTKVRSSLNLVKSPLMSAEWFIEPYSNEPEDIEIAEFVEWNLLNMHDPFEYFLREALLSLDYDHYVFEKVWEYADWTPSRDGAHTRRVLKLEKLSPRHPEKLDGWKFNDNNGEVEGVYHFDNNGNRKLLKRRKILLYTWDGEGGAPEGMSLLRPAWINWYYQQNFWKIDGIQKERHGIGIPRVKLAAGYKPGDKAIARQIGKNLRTNEESFVVEGPSFEVDFIELKGQVVNALESAQEHGGEIMANVLGKFMEATSAEGEKRSGTQEAVFAKSLKFLGDFVRLEVNHQLLPQLVDLNFVAKGYPKLRVRRITENVEWRTMSVALRNLGEPGFVTPTPELESWILDNMDFPAPSRQALNRTVKDRITKEGTVGVKDATNPNRDDQGNASQGLSPSGKPTQ